jgi:dCMP deaminase
MNWHNTYIEIAETISKHSKAERKKVGAVLVKNNRIISIGYNGTPSGFDNACEENGITKKEVIHAESNCITKCARSNESSDGSSLYVTLSPCMECSKLIIQSGIKEVFYKEEYRDTDGIKLLNKANINCIKINV